MALGGARLEVARRRSDGGQAVQTLASYPQKLVVQQPPSDQRQPQTVFALSYGGGIVSGDEQRLAVEVGPAARLLLTALGTTNVFKALPTRPRSRSIVEASVGPDALLIHLPHPTVCYAEAQFEQTTTYRLASLATSSVLAVDWYTQGRAQRDEHWAFASFSNTVRVTTTPDRAASPPATPPDEVLLLNDRTRLFGGQQLRAQLGGIGIVVSVLLAGPLLQPTATRLMAQFGARRQRQPDAAAAFEGLLVSCAQAPIHAPRGSCAVLLRLTARSMEQAAAFLHGCVGTLDGLLAENPFARLLGQSRGIILQDHSPAAHRQAPAEPQAATDSGSPSSVASVLAQAAALRHAEDSARRKKAARAPPAAAAPAVHPLAWQLIDTSLPTGGFAHSNGLEAVDHVFRSRRGRGSTVLAEADLLSYARAVLLQTASSQLPFVLAAHAIGTRGSRLSDAGSCSAPSPAAAPTDREVAGLMREWQRADRAYGCTVLNQVARRASTAQGMALLRVASELFERHPLFTGVKRSCLAGAAPAATAGGGVGPPCLAEELEAAQDQGRGRGHYAPVFGLVTGFCAAVGCPIPRHAAATMFLFVTLRDLLAAAVRLNNIGPMRGVVLQHTLGAEVAPILHAMGITGGDDARDGGGGGPGVDDAHAMAPLLEVYAGMHDQLYSRLFNS